MIAETIFWGALAIVAYVYVGFPALIYALATVRPRLVKKAPHEPTVSFIIAAYNEEKAIAEKIENTLALDYPRDRLEILVASDGSTDRTDEIVTTQFAGKATLVAVPGRGGKTLAQNRTVEHAGGEILVFSDATTVYRPDTLRKLMENYADPEIGCVTGWVVMGVEEETTIHRGRAAYADYEQWLRIHESRFASILGAGGAVYSLRRSLYTNLPADVTSDFSQAVKVVEQGYRAVIEPDAVVFEAGEGSDIRDELERRTRVATRGLRGQYYVRRFFNPRRHPWFFFQTLSHRLLRWAVPLFMIVAFVANLFLLGRPLYRVIFVGQLACYLAAALGYTLERRGKRVRLLHIPLYFCVVNLAPLLALRSLLRGDKKVVWETRR
jgi:cellulose synthase/poly-beta-1,6-N-acetylglucosamine synthase-like glycosyltransferase